VIARLAAVANVDFHARRHSLMSISQIRKDIGFAAKYDLPRALEDYLTWCRSAQAMMAA
jgi:nucleoside-diphosphate-sugar epimerase